MSEQSTIDQDFEDNYTKYIKQSVMTPENYDVIQSVITYQILVFQKEYLIHTDDDLFIPLKDFVLKSDMASFATLFSILEDDNIHNYNVPLSYHPELEYCGLCVCDTRDPVNNLNCQQDQDQEVNIFSFILSECKDIISQEKLLYLKLIE